MQGAEQVKPTWMRAARAASPGPLQRARRWSVHLDDNGRRLAKPPPTSTITRRRSLGSGRRSARKGLGGHEPIWRTIGGRSRDPGSKLGPANWRRRSRRPSSEIALGVRRAVRSASRARFSTATNDNSEPQDRCMLPDDRLNRPAESAGRRGYHRAVRRQRDVWTGWIVSTATPPTQLPTPHRSSPSSVSLWLEECPAQHSEHPSHRVRLLLTSLLFHRNPNQWPALLRSAYNAPRGL